MKIKKEKVQAISKDKKINSINKLVNKCIFIKIVAIFICASFMQNISYAGDEKDKSDIESEYLTSIDMVLEILRKDKEISDYENTYKYIYYKYTGNDSYKTELDFSAYDTSGFNDTTTISGNSIEEKVWFALIGIGASEYAAAGVMGNIYGESGFNPKLVEGGYNENNGGIGLCQWTNSSRGSTGRNTNLKKYAQKKGVTWHDEDSQVEFLITEIKGNGPAKGYAGKAFMTTNIYGRQYTENDWKKANNIEDATKAFCATFERPGSTYFYSSMQKRVDAAKKYYNQFHGKSQSATSGSSISVANGTSDEKLKYLFDNKIPTTESGCKQYMKTIKVPMTKKNGKKYNGNLTINKKLEKDVQDVFKQAQDAGFKIYEAAGFSYRKMNNGGTNLSHHSYGVAIDINVNENYSHRGSTVYAGSFWNPSKSEYSIPKNGILVKAFKAKGWSWGGNWSGNYQDYMHFSFTGH